MWGVPEDDPEKKIWYFSLFSAFLRQHTLISMTETI